VELVTLTLAAIAVFLVFRARPLMGFLVYMGLLCWYSAWQPVDIGGIHLTAPRIVIPILIWRATTERAIMMRFRWQLVDTAVILLTVGELAAGFYTTDIGALLQNRAGTIFDTTLVYFAARLIIVTPQEYMRFLKGMLVIAAPLAALGLYQAVTGSNPWGVFVNQGAAFEGDSVMSEWVENSRRMGFYRANVNFPHSITFGFFFALLVPAAAGVWQYLTSEKRRGFLILLAGTGVGMLTSMSAGPLLGGAMATAFIIAWPFRAYWKIFVALVVLSLVAVDIVSNRDWYDVLGWYLTFNPQTAGYRIQVIQEALGGGMADHWVAGYGIITPSNIGEVIKNWRHTDITNHYILELLRFGLLGTIPFIAVLVLALRNLRRGFLTARSIEQKWLMWCLAAGIAATMASMFSACWEGQGYNLFFAILGMAATAPDMVRSTAPRRLAYAPDPCLTAEGVGAGGRGGARVRP
jgi:MFS family permease